MTDVEGTLHSAHDLGAAVRDLRPDALELGIDISDDWCRDQMVSLGVTRYEAVDSDVLYTIVDRVDMK